MFGRRGPGTGSGGTGCAAREGTGEYAVAALTLVALAVLWRPFVGRIGVAFAMQEVIGGLAGWVNILSGRIFRPGDRIEMAGVRGDVLDLTPLRTKIL